MTDTAGSTPEPVGEDENLGYAAAESNEPHYIGGDHSLSPDEANSVVSRDESVLVIVAGDVKAGKTTLLIALFDQLLRGPFATWSFAGSQTMRVLDLIHKDARLSSGRAVATTERTQAEDMRLLHVTLQNKHRRLALLVSDVRGEFFEDLVNGLDVAQAVPLASRADLAVIAVDGAKLVDAAGVHLALWRAEQLIGALTEPGGLQPGTPLLIAITKADKLSPQQLKDVKSRVESDLIGFAQSRHVSPEFIAITARPDDHSSAPHNLVRFVNWLTAQRRPAAEDFSPSRLDGRIAWRPQDPA